MMLGLVIVTYPESVSDHDYDTAIELGKLDYQIFKEGRQRCLDAGGCPECFCVASEQKREHWSHCSRFAVAELAAGLEARDEAILSQLDCELPKVIEEVIEGLDAKKRRKVA